MERPSVFPGGRFDPLNFSEGKEANFFGEDLDTLKIKELKHCRLLDSSYPILRLFEPYP